MKPTDNTTQSNHDEPMSDGGSPTSEQSPFDTVSGSEMSRQDRYRRFIDLAILAPFRIIWTDMRARVGLLIILFYILMGTIGVQVVPNPTPHQGPRLIQPFVDWSHPLGTDISGQDMTALMVHAAPPMLKMITSGAIFTTAVATTVGTLSGYKGGLVDRSLMIVTDIMMTIPGLPLIIVIAVVLEPQNPWIVGLVLTVNAWAGLARNIRSQVLTLRNESYVEASRVMGVSTSEIVIDDILPNLMPYIMVNFVTAGRNVIFASVGLYFLGILPYNQANWGVIMNLAYTSGGALYTWQTAHWLIIPMIVIIVLVFGLILFAQGTDRLFNPRVRARHAKTIQQSSEVEESSQQESATDQGTL